MDINPNIVDYYRNRDVRNRLLEFMGGSTLDDVSAEFITADDESADVRYDSRPTADLWRCLDLGREVGRSLWDRKSLVVDLDIEYVNFDQPALPFVQPKLAYNLQQPVVEEVERWLLGWGISPLHWVSGQGHHFAWQIGRDSLAFEKLAWLGRLTSSLQSRYCRPSLPNGNHVGRELGAAFAGLGMLMEFIVSELCNTCRDKTEIPLKMTAVEAGPVRINVPPQREVIAFDISEYGDPLDVRGVRMPFSLYLKPGQKRYQLGQAFVEAMPMIFPIPLFELDVSTALDLMRDPAGVSELASRASTSIPDHSDQLLGLIDAYQQSPLAEFHSSFYQDEHDPPERWSETYDKTQLETLPGCVSYPLLHPNDLLLKPAVIQLVVRTLMSIGWMPRHIAGLIRSKYERDHDWGSRWNRYDAASRADFYVRMFAGSIVTGRDRLVDFNCLSTHEKRYCPSANCGHNLIDLRQQLLEKQPILDGKLPLESGLDPTAAKGTK